MFLAIQSAVTGTGYPPIGVPVVQASDEYPTVEILAPIVSFEGFGVQPGDRLLRVGSSDLEGAGSLEFFLRFVEAAEGRSFVELEVERGGRRLETTAPVVPLRMLAPVMFSLSPAFVIVGVLLILRSPSQAVTRALFHACLILGIACASLFGGAAWKTGFSMAIHTFVCFVTAPIVFRFLALFPHGRPITSRWVKAGILASSLVGVAPLSMVLGFPLSMATGVFWQPPIYGVALLAVILLFGSSYRAADPLERRRMKWLVYGGYVAILPPLLAFGTFALVGGDMRYAVLSQTSLVIIPIAFFIAIERANLFDVDRLISATMSINLLLAVAIGAALVVVPRVTEAASDLIGVDATTGQLALSALTALAVVPLQNTLRPRIEALFFRERHDLDVGIGELLAELSACAEPAGLAETAGEGLVRLLRPQTFALYAEEDGGYVALFAQGAAIPPAIPGASPLIATLRDRSQPLTLDERTHAGTLSELSHFDRAVLDTLGAHVVFPIARSGELALILCLGAKRSGDVYTPTDLALLSSVAHTISLVMQRFDEAVVGDETRRLHESLRRYVPGAIAEVIDHGDELEAKTRDVSVLFVDLRGYTSLSESSEAEQVFAAVSRYTECVSECIRRNGGTVVEFNGDGMMAVFGAPRELEHKEAAALRAAREIGEAVPQLAGPDGHVGTLLPGVGIATGPAFVGNIRAADRLIWSAIGNTTNLAARLEGLTRDLDAMIVIDRETWGGAEDTRDLVAHPAVKIRGRSGAQDLFVLPLEADANRAASATRVGRQ